MNVHSAALWLISLMFSGTAIAETGITISGTISGAPAGTPVVVRCYRLEGNSLSKADLYCDRLLAATRTLSGGATYQLNGLEPGRYAVVAFADLNKDGAIGFDPPEPFGWVANEAGGYIGTITANADTGGQDITLRSPTPFPRQPLTTVHGSLRYLQGIPVLHLSGTAAERGYAHGYLIGRQIIDFFEFYLLEEQWRSPQDYERIYVPFIERNCAIPAAMSAECDAVIAGMRAAGTQMRIEALGRDFGRADLIAINAYIERRAAFPVAPPASSCSQFAFWGERTRGDALAGALIAGRNMDGECDARKVTVSHFLVFAVEPAETGRKRFISAMWPGFVGTITGFNEDGLYSMENAGGSQPGPVSNGVVPCSWVQREALSDAKLLPSPDGLAALMSRFRNASGGVTSPGSVILWAMPFSGQQAPAFVWEGDRAGGGFRLPGDAAPNTPDCIMATNHYLKYGYDPAHPDLCFGLPIGLSSLWRYEAGANMIDAWARAGKAVGIAEMQRLLQTVAHGTTEHALIVIPHQRRVFIAVDDLKADLWDAPYQEWREFAFEQFFGR